MSDEKPPGQSNPEDAPADLLIIVPDDYEADAEILETLPFNNIHRTLKPWHRPRKQLVRRLQWATSLKKLITDVGLADQVSYLGLPGDEFLDVRYLAGGPITEAGLTLKFLGFNDSDDAQAANTLAEGDSMAVVTQLSALEETRNHASIDRDSEVQPDDIRRLGTIGSPAYIKVENFGPFDVVNLDLTQSVFAKSFQGDTYTDAIRQLFGLQTRATHDWLLWVTTRVDKQAVHDSHAATLLRLVQGRFTDCAALLEQWTPDQFDAASPFDVDLNSCTERDFAAVVFIGMCLWLYGLGDGPVLQPMTVISSFGYRVKDGASDPDMFSLVLRVSPKIAVPMDASGLTALPPPVQRPDKCAQLKQVLLRLDRTSDIEEQIEGNPELREQLIDETATLLELLRIDRGTYRSWVEQYRA